MIRKRHPRLPPPPSLPPSRSHTRKKCVDNKDPNQGSALLISTPTLEDRRRSLAQPQSGTSQLYWSCLHPTQQKRGGGGGPAPFAPVKCAEISPRLKLTKECRDYLLCSMRDCSCWPTHHTLDNTPGKMIVGIAKHERLMPPPPPSPYFQDLPVAAAAAQQQQQRLQQQKHQRHRPPKTIYKGRPCLYREHRSSFHIHETNKQKTFWQLFVPLLPSTHLAHPYLPNLPRKRSPSGRETCIADRFV